MPKKLEPPLKQAHAVLTAKLREGLDSGTPIPLDEEYFEWKRRELAERGKNLKAKSN